MAAWAVPLIGAGVSALAGYFGSKKKTQTNLTETSNASSSGTSLGTESGRSISGPQLSPAYQTFLDKLISSYSNLAGPVNLRPYAAQQIQGINRANQLSSQSVNNILAARGLSTSPVAGAIQAGQESNRIGSIINLQQQIPLLQRQIELENLGAARGMAALLPSLSPTVTDYSGQRTGATTGISSGVTNRVGTESGTSGGGAGGIFNTLAALIAANSANQATGTGGANQPGLAGILASLFGGGNS